jgi:hypothetical protein
LRKKRKNEKMTKEYLKKQQNIKITNNKRNDGNRDKANYLDEKNLKLLKTGNFYKKQQIKKRDI